MSRASRVLGAAVGALAIGACGSDSASPTPGVQIALLSATVTPNPISTIQSSPAGPTWSVNYIVKLTESNGLGGKVELLSGALYDDANGALIARNQFDDRDLIVFVGANRVEPNGSLEIRQDLSYVASAKRPTSVVVTVRFRDDRGNLIEPSLIVRAN